MQDKHKCDTPNCKNLVYWPYHFCNECQYKKSELFRIWKS